MALFTSILNLLKKNPATEGADTFNIQTMLNDNWDKIDAAMALKAINGSVRVATTNNTTLSGLQTVDGISLASGDRVLVKNQTTGSQNGIYVAAAGAWARAADADSSAKLGVGLVVYVREGTLNGGKGFVLSNAGSVTLGTTVLTFALIQAPMDAAGTASTAVVRDGAGRAQVAAPSAAADIARKDTVDAAIATASADATSKANAAQSAATSAAATDATTKANAVQANLTAHIGTGGTSHAAATTSAAGFMSAADKAKLDGVTAGAGGAGTATDTVIGNRTISDTSTPTGDSGTVTTLFGWLANMIKAITGKSSWRTAPATTLEAAKSHMDATVAHGAVSTPTASAMMVRDSAGRAQVATPSASADIARKDTVDAAIVTAAADATSKADAAVSAAATDATTKANAVQATLTAHIGTGGTSHAVATTSVAGFMSAADKTKLDGVTAGAGGAGTATDTVIGNRTISDTSTPTGDSGTVTTLFGWLANMIKAITGKSSWRTAPATTLEAAKSHMDATVAHGAVSTPTASAMMVRDSAGRAQVATPSASADIARKDTVDAAIVTAAADATSKADAAVSAAATDATTKANAVQANLTAHIGTGGTSHAAATTSVAGFMSAADKTKLDGVTAGAGGAGTATDTVIGNRTISDTTAPTGDSGTVTTLFGWLANMIKAITGKSSWRTAPATTLEAAKSHMDATVAHGAVSTPTASTMMVRDSAGRAQVAAPSAAADIARKDTVDVALVTAAADATSKADAAQSAAISAASADATTKTNTVQTNLTTHAANNSHIPYAVTAGSTNTYTVTISPAPAALTAGLALAVQINIANTGAATINVNGLGAKSILNSKGGALTAGKLVANGIYTLRYNGTAFILQGEGGEYGTAAAAQVLAGYTIGTDVGIVTGTIPSNPGYATPVNIASGGGGYLYARISKGAYLTGSSGSGGTYPEVEIYDANFKAENIISGKSIFGLAGGIPNRSVENFHMPAVEDAAWTPGTSGNTYTRVFERPPQGYYDGSSWVYRDVPDLLPQNILSGKNIFGIAGNAIAGKRFASGTTTGGSVTVNGLAFKPRIVLLEIQGSRCVYFADSQIAAVNEYYYLPGPSIEKGFFWNSVTVGGFSVYTQYANYTLNWWAWE